ncbi:hypothetical protein PbJCM13498_20450 [Prolixibacter bellariivorans]|uniref:Bacteriophage abortive infection AbiH n=1 Tax=Prolixibacter bellariivorans TaxID=314319 RepID=A0A5M4AZ54_9BACT|nr:AbiH family protein [Prolixibacter bellariivorans]GET33182.1 hypothetical protein PbJCM13498_20450 [Prolixibacter bellariivorans]
MNRLIIIGNGFDLAHGLETSCKHFVLHYLSKVWSKLMNGSYEDKLLTIRRSSDYFDKNDLNYSNETALSIFKKIDKNTSNGPDDASMVFKSKFFKAIFKKILTLNWADIETEYFNELFHIIEKTNKSNAERIDLDSHKHAEIKKLNEELDYLQDILIKYLKDQEREFLEKNDINEEYENLFSESIYEGEKVQPRLEHPKSNLFLNFNYTSTLTKYNQNGNIIHIHGTLDDNPIFGFGDDTSPKYTTLEDEYNNEALKKIKSFKYLDNDKYSKLIHFINLDDFQIHIYGHSCGVSDRTLFKQIFEHTHCKKIKIFYHNQSDFEEKKYEISRHFKNKVEFLSKVVSFDNLREMPQIKK